MASRWLGPVLRRLGELFGSIGPSDFVIRHRAGRPIEVGGRIARSKVAGIAEFFDRDLDAAGPTTVRGSWSGRALRLKISGEVGPTDRQRIRNFLVEFLR